MATLRSILETASGLYRETRSGQEYQRQDLLALLPDEALDTPVHIRKVCSGVYQIELATADNMTYNLYSRRRSVRSDHPNSFEDT